MPVRYWKHSKVRTAQAPFLSAASHRPLPGELISTPWPWKARAQALQSPLVKLQNCKLLSTLTDTQTHKHIRDGTAGAHDGAYNVGRIMRQWCHKSNSTQIPCHDHNQTRHVCLCEHYGERARMKESTATHCQRKAPLQNIATNNVLLQRVVKCAVSSSPPDFTLPHQTLHSSFSWVAFAPYCIKAVWKSTEHGTPRVTPTPQRKLRNRGEIGMVQSSAMLSMMHDAPSENCPSSVRCPTKCH